MRYVYSMKVIKESYIAEKAIKAFTNKRSTLLFIGPKTFIHILSQEPRGVILSKQTCSCNLTEERKNPPRAYLCFWLCCIFFFFDSRSSGFFSRSFLDFLTPILGSRFCCWASS
ncbi:unnamed protein product [Citrullus colocynthis]|uniref:Uncharacterized protein n=1 Tax=Citrullus colocynthis TaxID=252529 RepID=A0ABP0YST6_9ROSI